MNTQLFDYVKQQLAQGVSKETIQNNLISQGGWKISDINEVFSALGVNNINGIPVAPNIASTQTSSQTQTSLPGVFTLLGQALSIYKKDFGYLWVF